jgi:hypothetical protein
VTVGILFAQVWLRVDPRLIFPRQGPVFLTGWAFFGQHLDRPGGLTEYAAAFLSQLHALGWPGAAVLAAMAAAIALAGWAVFRRLGRRGEILAAVPVVLLMVLATRYDHPMTTWSR